MTDQRETRHGLSPLWNLATEELEDLRAGLRLLALRSLGDTDAAEDAAQETLTRTLGAILGGQIDHPSKVAAFARGVARHVIVDLLRARGRLESLESLSEEEAALQGHDALDLAVTSEENQRVQAALERLDPADQHLLRLSFFDGLTPIQVGALMGEPAERIRKRKSRALERLREAFLGSARSHEVDSTSTTEKEPAAPSSRKAGES